MVTIDGHKLAECYGMEHEDLEALKQKAIRTRSDGAGGTIYTIPYREIEAAIRGDSDGKKGSPATPARICGHITEQERQARDLARIREANAALACKGGE
ncbi:MAG TPA: hypothetical protein VLO13_02930 [Halomonas sp.]|nr:hypothetical protein [Halomonas sp.]